MSSDLIPDHYILHQPFCIQPRVIMANLDGSEFSQVLALKQRKKKNRIKGLVFGGTDLATTRPHVATGHS